MKISLQRHSRRGAPTWITAFGICVALSTAASAAPIGSESSERPLLRDDASAADSLAQAKAEIAGLGVCAASCLASLEVLHRDFAPDVEVVSLLKSSYAQLGDWGSLIALEKAFPSAGERQRETLAAYHHKAGRYREATDLLESVADERPTDPRVAHQLGIVLFEAGEHERAAHYLDKALADLRGATAGQSAMLRGLIHFHAGELEAARRRLEQALAVDADDPSALNGLARVAAAQGRQAEADELLRRAAELRDRITASERRQMRMNSMSRLASKACRERRFDDCESVVLDMLDMADERQRVALYRYLSEVQRASGRIEDAERSLALAAEIEKRLANS